MADVHEPKVRSYNMSRIKGKNTKPEIIVRKFLFSKGFRYRLHVKNLPGKPDIVLPKYKIVIFIHGCFWHSHENCKYAAVPKSNIDFWNKKLSGNKEKDKVNEALLKKACWKVIKIWECELKTNVQTNTLDSLCKKIK